MAAVRWGILGTGRAAVSVASAIREASGAELAAVASRDEKRAVDWAAEQDCPLACGSYRQLLENRDVDAVYVAIPPGLHHEWVVAAAEHGKHVLCERPLATSIRDAMRMVDVCREYSVVLMDAVKWLHHERTFAMQQMLESGRVGKVRRIHLARSFYWQDLPDEDPRLESELGGGCLNDFGYECARAAWWVLREVPTQVMAAARYYRDVPFSVSAMLWFEDEQMALLDCGYDTVARQWIEIAGTQGSLVCDDFFDPSPAECHRFWFHDAQSHTTHTVEQCQQGEQMIERFSQAVAEGDLQSEWSVDPLATLRIVAALEESIQSGQIVEV